MKIHPEAVNVPALAGLHSIQGFAQWQMGTLPVA